MPAETISVQTRDGTCPALLFRPSGSGPHPAVVVGQEATGPNAFIGRVGEMLADAGFVVVVPDYYRGDGPPDPEAYEDIETLIPYMDRLDFRRATYDLLAALDFLAAQADVDSAPLAVWGYCTGATITLLAACLRPGLAATVLFYPSQPRFEVHDVTRPVDPVDLVWNLTSPVLLLVGDADPVWPPALVAETRTRLEQWGIEHTIATFAGAGHAFCAPTPAFHDAAASAAATALGLNFLRRHT